MSVVLMFLCRHHDGSLASEKTNGTLELLLTLRSRSGAGDGSFRGAAFVAILVLLLALSRDPLHLRRSEIGKTAAGLLGLLLVGLVYAAIGAFASSVTRNQVIAFVLSFVLLLVLWMLGFLADLGAAGGAPTGEWIATCSVGFPVRTTSRAW